MTSVVRLSHVRVGQTASPILEDIQLEVASGSFLGIIGPNGAGKTTLLTLMAGLRTADAGSVELFGEVLRSGNRARLLKQVGFLKQLHEETNPMPLRAAEVVAMGLVDYGSPMWHRLDQGERMTTALDRVGMGDLAKRDFRTLSGGQQQRVRLARALVRAPRLLLLDEPSAGLDSHGQDQLYRLLRRLCDEDGMAVVMVEHDIAAITAHVDAVACLNVRIHHHAVRGERIPESVWHRLYGDHMHVVAHDSHCIGCADPGHDDADSTPPGARP